MSEHGDGGLSAGCARWMGPQIEFVPGGPLRDGSHRAAGFVAPAEPTLAEPLMSHEVESCKEA